VARLRHADRIEQCPSAGAKAGREEVRREDLQGGRMVEIHHATEVVERIDHEFHDAGAREA